MSKYLLTLSQEADYDLDRLYTDGFIRWGEVQADTYYEGLLSHFDDLCINPYLYRAVDEIREGYRRSVYGKHAIFYRFVEQSSD
ncbi:MAG: Unknown protein [uncultured Thiotrichaceae bacterium]|uniref:Type II toxin-antitoxin system RelE/ParE family toxin n=1 Tax=uncultured Thiotrichaceae bacterium TaxID=298394 RepID=A0A6S6TCV2_9GAMM|nr:MAG: Unknown protein [uncultured Thiotrichaceae bacterium]